MTEANGILENTIRWEDATGFPLSRRHAKDRIPDFVPKESLGRRTISDTKEIKSGLLGVERKSDLSNGSHTPSYVHRAMTRRRSCGGLHNRAKVVTLLGEGR